MLHELLVPDDHRVSLDNAWPQFLERWITAAPTVYGRYQVLAEIACSAPERCFVALPVQMPINPPAPSVDQPLFVRVVRREQLAADLATRVQVTSPALEELFDIVDGPTAGEACIATRFVHGASVRVLGEALVRRRQRLPWSVTLAIYAQARAALAAFADRGLSHGALTASRVRLDVKQSRTVVCRALTAPERAARSDRVELARVVLPLAARSGRELELVDTLQHDDDLLVLRDHLIEQQRANEELVLAAFDDIGTAPPLVESAKSTLWTWVAGCVNVGIS